MCELRYANPTYPAWKNPSGDQVQGLRAGRGMLPRSKRFVMVEYDRFTQGS